MIANEGFKAGLGMREEWERLAFRWKGAQGRLVERDLTPVQAISTARSELNKLTAKLRANTKLDSKKVDSRNVSVAVAVVFSPKDAVGKFAGCEVLIPDTPSPDADDLNAMQGHSTHVPIGLLVCIVDKGNRELIAHARPWRFEPEALRLLENRVEEMTKLEDWRASKGQN